LETTYDEDRGGHGKPLDGIRVLAAEHMQALPYGTQLLAHLGAEVIKVEPPGGEAGRAARPLVPQPDGSTIGGTFARNNLGKLSITLDLKSEAGTRTFLELAKHCDVVAENMRPGVMDRLGVGYAQVSAANPRAIFLSVSGFGNLVDSPYRGWPAYAPAVEAMSGLYEIGRYDGEPPRPSVVGPIGDTSAAMFGVIGVLAALRHRDRSGLGQYVDISMYDAMIALNEMYVQVTSLGLPAATASGRGTGILHSFRAADGYFLIVVNRDHQFARLASALDQPGWVTDPRFADRAQWGELVPAVVAPAVERWVAGRTRAEVVAALGEFGIVAGPCHTMEDLRTDEHVEARHMLIEVPTGGEPALVAGNPVKMSRLSEGPVQGLPSPGQHTEDILAEILKLSADDLSELRAAGAFGASAGSAAR
jgi:formyl-CoA transferase